MQRTLRAAAIIVLIAAAATAAADEWSDLMHGNARYVAGHLVYSHLRAQRRAWTTTQRPPVTIISCADSRVPPELMFDQTIGDLFVVRVAGNVADTFNLASVEYGIENKWTKLIVVMGHENCGAVSAAIGGKTYPKHLDELVAKIRSNLGGRTPPLREATDMNARATAKELVEKSTIIANAVRDGKVKIVTAYYSFDGRVTKLDD
jgi:carbonic anhydrase